MFLLLGFLKDIYLKSKIFNYSFAGILVVYWVTYLLMIIWLIYLTVYVEWFKEHGFFVFTIILLLFLTLSTILNKFRKQSNSIPLFYEVKDIAKLRVFITPPLFEEVDRAINYTLLILLFGLENNIVLILITSIIFAVMHFEILELKDIKSVLPRFLEYFLMGIILGVTMVYAGLAFSILLHALQNYISVISGKKERLELDEQAKPFRVIVHDVNGIMTEEWNFENLDNYKPH